MSKNILIFADGTGQAGGVRPDQTLSNIYKLYRATRTGADSPIKPSEQIAFYDAGLGTDPDSSAVPFRFLRTLRKVFSAATGTGISNNIVECYQAILKHYEPGDRIYLFGFSRGAYTVRCVAGVLNLCGVPTEDGNKGMLPRCGKQLKAIANEAVRSVYEHGAGRNRAQFEPEREEKARRFREKYVSGAGNASNAAPYFIGVFDTVAALGSKGLRRWLLMTLLASVFLAIPIAVIYRLGGSYQAALWYAAGLILVAGFQATVSRLRIITRYPSGKNFRWHLSGWKSGFYDHYLDPRVRYVRHALAIDEHRSDFARVPWGKRAHSGPPREKNEPEWFQQIWFAGCHSDIGGGYPEDESRLSDVALGWMVEQIKALRDPVTVDDSKLHLFPSSEGMQHCEVEGLLDRYPLWWPAALRKGWEKKERRLVSNATLHPSVIQRFNAARVLRCGRWESYRPEALRKHCELSFYYPSE